MNFKNYKINYRYSKLKLDHKSFYHKIFDHFIKKYLKNLSNKKKLVLEVGAGKGYRAKYLYRKVNYTGLEPTKLPFLKYNLCKKNFLGLIDLVTFFKNLNINLCIINFYRNQ